MKPSNLVTFHQEFKIGEETIFSGNYKGYYWKAVMSTHLLRVTYRGSTSCHLAPTGFTMISELRKQLIAATLESSL